MKTLRNEAELVASWDLSLEPVVSICCVTYNHENFLEETLAGFLIQETSFPFEILIHDDASTDKTADIILEYQNRYPKIIKSILQKENQRSQRRVPFFNLQDISRGEFIAYCEGDDFWTDPKKLQIQIDFLRKNSEYVISGHDAFIVNEKGDVTDHSKLPKAQQRDFDGQQLIKGAAWILTMSCVYRNVIKEKARERELITNGDRFFVSQLGHFGKSKFHNEIKPSGYRVHSSGIWSSLSKIEKKEQEINSFFWTYKYYKRKKDDVYANYYWNRYVVCVAECCLLRLLEVMSKNEKLSFFLDKIILKNLKKIKGVFQLR